MAEGLSCKELAEELPSPAVKGESDMLGMILTDQQGDVFRVVILGKTGMGKSSLGNTLLGRDAFDLARGVCSGTEKCKWEEGFADELKLSVTDTPGLCDTHRSEKEVLLEIAKSVSVACPGPHVAILVLRCDRPFTKEEYDAVKTLLAIFGDKIRRHLMVVFTGGDSLRVPLDDMQKALEKELKRASVDLEEVLHDAFNRYCVVDNTGSYEDRKQHASTVLTMIKDVVKKNNGAHFTNDMIEEYNQMVQTIIARRKKTLHLTHDEAVRKTNKDIIDGKEDSGFLELAKKHIPTVLLCLATGMAVRRCSVM